MNLFPTLRSLVWILACVALLACDTSGLTPDPDEEDLPDPVILGFEDAEGTPVTMGAVGSSVVIVGESFGTAAPGNIVLFGTSRAIVLGVDDEGMRITVTIPFLSFTGEVEVTVTVGSRTSAPAPFTVLAPQSVGVGDGPFGIASADFDGDGIRDLITANKYSDDLSLLLGRGDGTFTLVAVIPAGDGPSHVEVDDVDFDGRPDLIVLHKFDDSLRIFFGGEGLVFEESISFDVPNEPTGMVYEDFNGDGRPDVAVISQPTHLLKLFLTGEGGGLAPAGILFLNLVGQPLFIDTADIDGNGHADLVIAQGITLGDESLLNFWGKITILLGDGNGGFPSRRGLPLDMPPISATPADIDGDGLVDLAVPDFFGDNVRIYIGDGEGGFHWSDTVPTFLLTDYTRVKDLNADSRADIVALSASGQVLALMGDGAGGFTATETAMVGQMPFQFIIEDINGDGRLDVATSNTGSDDISLLPGDEEGRFASIRRISVDDSDPMGFTVRNHPMVIAAADFDADGTPDLATANIFCADGDCGQFPLEGSYGNASILKGDGFGGFTEHSAFLVGEDSIPTTILAYDQTGDGLADVVVSSVISHDVRIFAGDGSGGFTPALAVDLTRPPLLMKKADLNGDGFADLATSNRDTDDVSFLMTTAPGGLAPPVHHGVGSLPSGLAFGDFNVDSIPDIVTANEGSGTLSFLLGIGGGAFAPQEEILIPQGSNGRWPFRVETGDFNGDGIPDLAVLCREPNVLQVLLLDGAAGFLETFETNLAYKPIDLRILDVNHDSARDIAVVHKGSNVISIFTGDGSGRVALHAHFTAGIGPIQFAAVDLTDDGCHDFAVANPFLGSITLLYGDCGGNLLIRPPGLGPGVTGEGK